MSAAAAAARGLQTPAGNSAAELYADYTGT